MYNKLACKICGSNSYELHYEGIIRAGKYGNWTDKPKIILKCSNCSVLHLINSNIDYENGEYRKMYDGSSSPENYYRNHDKEQAEKLNYLGTDGIRDRVIADVGCGAGSFLDLVAKYAKKTIAIEPYHGYHKELKNKGYSIFSYTKDCLEEYEGKVDIVVSFAVIEHVDNPFAYITEIRRLLIDDGYLVLSTPNNNDWLIKFLPGIYDRFHYRLAHKWYFNEVSLKYLGERTGYREISIDYFHRYDLSNAFIWARDKKPAGINKDFVLKDLDGQFKKILIDNKCSDYIYAKYKK